ncbi:MAG TPA: hypothetical protein VFN94_05545 [Nitrospiria bacterium]|nr:hypothetical protein [Nitrospiria bacterium]
MTIGLTELRHRALHPQQGVDGIVEGKPLMKHDDGVDAPVDLVQGTVKHVGLRCCGSRRSVQIVGNLLKIRGQLRDFSHHLQVKFRVPGLKRRPPLDMDLTDGNDGDGDQGYQADKQVDLA